MVAADQQKFADVLIAMLSKQDVMSQDIKDILRLVSPADADDESAKISETLALMANAITRLADILEGVKGSVDDLVRITRSGTAS
ncbi:MAG: hypothetical protein ABF719_10710 [Acetobacter sp.]|uniref:hypothetical protein n=1 Tax=Acetobacter sp. TaxID=440 RepID=UPI0039E847D2